MVPTKLRVYGENNGPGTFYFSDAGSDWTSPQSNALWRDAFKTLFDPCPQGWRVPRGGAGRLSPWSAFTVENGPWNGEATNPLGGRMFLAGGVWYPASGFRDSRVGGYLGTAGNYEHVWSTHLTPEQYWIFRFNAKLVDDGSDSNLVRNRFLDFGLSVRCIRE